MDAVIMHYCIHELHWSPRKIYDMDRKEKLLLYASFQLYQEHMREREKKMKAHKPKRRRR